MLFFSNHVDFTFPIFDDTKLPITKAVKQAKMNRSRTNARVGLSNSCAMILLISFTFAVLNITIKYKCIFEKKSCSELTLTLVLNDYRLNQTATLLIGEPSQLEL